MGEKSNLPTKDIPSKDENILKNIIIFWEVYKENQEQPRIESMKYPNREIQFIKYTVISSLMFYEKSTST